MDILKRNLPFGLAFWILFFTIGVNAQTKKKAVNAEMKKLYNYLSSRRTSLREERCPNCSYTILFKLHFDESMKPESVQPSGSLPETLKDLPGEIRQLDINWKVLLGNKSIVRGILPVSFICEGKGGRITYPSSATPIDIFSFTNDGLRSKSDDLPYTLLPAIGVIYVSSEVNTGDPVLKLK